MSIKHVENQIQQNIQVQKQEQIQEVENNVMLDNVEQQKQSNLDNEMPEAVQKEQIKRNNEPPYEPEDGVYIQLSKKGAEIQAGDSDKMKKIRRYIKDYVQAPTLQAKQRALEGVIKACNSYTFMKFSLFKGARAKERLNQVKDVRTEAQTALDQVKEKRKEKGNTVLGKGPEFIYNEASEVEFNGFTGVFAHLVGLGRFLVENPIRLALKAVVLPFWAINEAIISSQRKRGVKVPNRHLKFPGLHGFNTYSKRTLSVLKGQFNQDGREAYGFLEYYKKEDFEIQQRMAADMAMAQEDIDDEEIEEEIRQSNIEDQEDENEDDE